MTKPSSFLENFRQVANSYPENTAILFQGQKALTYSQLDLEASLLAFELQKLKLSPGAIIGLCLEKSPEYIISLLAVWFSQAAFLPLDPKLPKERLAFICKESSLSAVIVDKAGQTLFQTLQGAFLDDIPTVLVDMLPEPDATRDVNVSNEVNALPLMNVPAYNPDDLAYVIYTSGSTGQPKGVLVNHSGIVNFIRAQIEEFQLDASSRFLFYLSTSFDASISDIGTTLLSGATLCLEKANDLQPGLALAQLIADRQISHMDIPPSLLGVMDAELMPACLKTIIIGGEACSPQVVRQWAKQVRVVNVYGPTEATVCTSMCVCDSQTWTVPLIGKPIPGIRYRLVDQDQRLCQPGAPGELYISGIGLSRGYINRPELNKEKFVLYDNERFYRTGDFVVETALGEFQFLGRIDRQFKWRGLLIEPEEIESKLLSHDQVQSAAVLKRALHESSSRQIFVAYVVLSPGSNISPVDLRRFLSDWLPLWMVPQRFEILDSLPSTITGKTDFAQLRQLPLSSNFSKDESAPWSLEENTKEWQFIELCKQVLGLEYIDLDDTFFSCGGDSFATLEVVLRAENCGLAVNPEWLTSDFSFRNIIARLNASASGSRKCSFLRRDFQQDSLWQTLKQRLRQCQPLPQNESDKDPQAILLTGATGFLGARLLTELFARTRAKIYCLVRAGSQSAARDKIEVALRKQGLATDFIDSDRLIVVLGRLELPYCDLEQVQWQGLANTIDTIYHLAAQVNMVLPYEELRPSNVAGTLEIARLMCQGRAKSLHYASTLSVLVASDRNQGTLFESDDLSQTKEVWGGYAQTKWVAEALLRSLEPVLGPVSYYRFGLITGDVKSGHCSQNDFLAMFCQGIAAIGKLPFPRSSIHIDITPVDYAAAVMSELSLQKHINSASRTFHVANPSCLSLDDLVSHMRKYGVQVDEVPIDQFRVSLQNENITPPTAAAFLALCRLWSNQERFADFRSMDLFQATGVTFDMTNTMKALEHSSLKCPDADEKLVHRYLECFFKQGCPVEA